MTRLFGRRSSTVSVLSFRGYSNSELARFHHQPRLFLDKTRSSLILQNKKHEKRGGPQTAAGSGEHGQGGNPGRMEERGADGADVVISCHVCELSIAFDQTWSEQRLLPRWPCLTALTGHRITLYATPTNRKESPRVMLVVSILTGHNPPRWMPYNSGSRSIWTIPTVQGCAVEFPNRSSERKAVTVGKSTELRLHARSSEFDRSTRVTGSRPSLSCVRKHAVSTKQPAAPARSCPRTGRYALTTDPVIQRGI